MLQDNATKQQLLSTRSAASSTKVQWARGSNFIVLCSPAIRVRVVSSLVGGTRATKVRQFYIGLEAADSIQQHISAL